jgi:hypothetical protein
MKKENEVLTEELLVLPREKFVRSHAILKNLQRTCN